MSGEKQKELVL